MHSELTPEDWLDEDEILNGLIELERENMMQMWYLQEYMFMPADMNVWPRPDTVFAQLTSVSLSSPPATFEPESKDHYDTCQQSLHYTQALNQLIPTMVNSAETQLESSDESRESVSDSEQFVTSWTRSPESSDSEPTSDPETDKPIASHKKVAGLHPRPRQRRLCKFLLDTLENEIYCPSIIAWVDRETGVFRFVQPARVARLWGESRRRKSMTYEHLSRAMRYYYASGIMKRVAGHGRLVYQFLEPYSTINDRSKKQRRSRSRTTDGGS